MEERKKFGRRRNCRVYKSNKSVSFSFPFSRLLEESKRSSWASDAAQELESDKKDLIAFGKRVAIILTRYKTKTKSSAPYFYYDQT